MTKVCDLSGQKFGRLSVANRNGSSSDGKAMWDCVCDCGNKTTVIGKLLRSGNTASCGCISDETRRAPKKHGMTETPEYTTWRRIKTRCFDTNSPDFPDYGGRGINMQREWVDDFCVFFRHVGCRPSPQHSIERIDNAVGYIAGNVRWATSIEQANNKRSNVVLVAFGKSKTMAQWARDAGIAHGTLKHRIYRGWDAERAISEPTK